MDDYYLKGNGNKYSSGQHVDLSVFERVIFSFLEQLEEGGGRRRGGGGGDGGREGRFVLRKKTNPFSVYQLVLKTQHLKVTTAMIFLITTSQLCLLHF